MKRSMAVLLALAIGFMYSPPGTVALAEGDEEELSKTEENAAENMEDEKNSAGTEDSYVQNLFGNLFSPKEKKEELLDNNNSGQPQEAEQEISDRESSGLKNLQIPQKFEVVIDPWEVDRRGQVYSDQYTICNTGETSGILTLSNLVCRPREQSGVIVRTDKEGLHDSGDKSIYMEMLFGNGERIIFSQESSRYQTELKPGEELSICFSGEVNENAFAKWENTDIAVSVVYSWKMEEKPDDISAEEPEESQLKDDDAEEKEEASQEDVNSDKIEGKQDQDENVDEPKEKAQTDTNVENSEKKIQTNTGDSKDNLQTDMSLKDSENSQQEDMSLKDSEDNQQTDMSLGNSEDISQENKNLENSEDDTQVDRNPENSEDDPQTSMSLGNPEEESESNADKEETQEQQNNTSESELEKGPSDVMDAENAQQSSAGEFAREINGQETSENTEEDVSESDLDTDIQEGMEIGENNLQIADQEEIKNVTLQEPQKVDVIIDSWKVEQKGRIVSPEFVLQNTGDAVGTWSLSELICKPQEQSGIRICMDKKEIQDSGVKSVYLELVLGNGEKIVLSQENAQYEVKLNPGEKLSVQFAGEMKGNLFEDREDGDIAVTAICTWNPEQTTDQ